MNNDPLQRRMFAQQIINQHTRANQPMGILASSPQLMGAVQGFKDGGAVKGYQAGGVNLSNFGKDFPQRRPLAPCRRCRRTNGSEGAG